MTLSQKVENEYIGCPCGVLDQTMIYFAKANMGTHFNPQTKAVTYVPLGGTAGDKLRVVGLDTGTVRHGLEKSTYVVRRAECEQLVALVKEKGCGQGEFREPWAWCCRTFGRVQEELSFVCALFCGGLLEVVQGCGVLFILLGVLERCGGE